MPATNRQVPNFTLRLPAVARDVIAEAATLEGTTAGAFVRVSAIRAARLRLEAAQKNADPELPSAA